MAKHTVVGGARSATSLGSSARSAHLFASTSGSALGNQTGYLLLRSAFHRIWQAGQQVFVRLLATENNSVLTTEDGYNLEL